MWLADIQVWWIKRTIINGRSHFTQYGFNQSTLEIDTMKTPMVVQFEKKSYITVGDDPLPG
jgi:hypothetical protein